MMGAAENSTVATETENQNPFELLQKHPCLSASHTHAHTLTHTYTRARRGAWRWSFVCMKMEIMTKNRTKNITTSKNKKKKNKIKNLCTLHVLIKVTEPVRILDSSCI